MVALWRILRQAIASPSLVYTTVKDFTKPIAGLLVEEVGGIRFLIKKK